MQNLGTSIIRTVVPMLVGALVTWLTDLEVPLPAGYEDAAVAVTTVAVGGVWYAGVRWAGQRWPVLERLLGAPTAPSYAGWETPQVQAAVAYALTLDPTQHQGEHDELLAKIGVTSDAEARRLVGLDAPDDAR